MKKRIEKDIFVQDLPFPRIWIRYTLDFYTKWHKYLKTLLEETHRYDLQGSPSEDITEAEREYALRKLDQYKEHHESRHKKNKKSLVKPSTTLTKLDN